MDRKAINIFLNAFKKAVLPYTNSIYQDKLVSGTNIKSVNGQSMLGSGNLVVSSNLALGETSNDAYRGDRGKTAYDHSQSTHAPSNANYYEHPASHSPSIITQDSSNRFVSDSEKSTWNAKQDALVSGTSIKTINDTSILGSGNIVISGSGLNQQEVMRLI